MIPIYIGYDPREAVAYNVLNFSIVRRATRPVTVAPLVLPALADVLTRPRHPLQSTDFSFSRFLVPYLSGYQGWSLFMDCDMLMLDDVARLWALRDERFAVMVVKHDHRPTSNEKFLGEPQTAYAKKNWSSVMLFNNALCTSLTSDYVNTASGLELHQFRWLDSEALVGELPVRWNHLVGVNPASRAVSLVHYTQGGPYFPEYAECEYSKEWFDERAAMQHVATRAAATTC